MKPETFISSEEAVDLSTCDREPIHIPGAIQPHGVMLVLEAASRTVVQASANTASIFGQEPEALVGRPLDAVLAQKALNRVLRRLAEADIAPSTVASLPVAMGTPPEMFEALIHRSGPHLILEFEPTDAFGDDGDMQEAHAQLQAVIEHLQEAHSLQALADLASEEVRRLTGFDRVKLYRFDDDWNGRVVAEARAEHMDSYLGLHFPATDIPKQARALYTLNRTRLIVDAGYEPAPLVPARSPLTDAPLDLSYSSLRSVSPVHIQYLRNMGVAASMSISIVHEGRLWGLLACHHATPRFVPYNTRTACALLGQVLALLLADRQEIEDQAYVAYLKEIQGRLLEAMVRTQTFSEGLRHRADDVLDLTAAAGVAIFTPDEYLTIGDTPPEAMVHELVDWLDERPDDEVFVTEKLAEDFAPAAGFEDVASGLLAVSLSRLQRAYLLWFRPEVSRTVYWAGAPTKAVGIDDGRLHPRRSFETWTEVQRGRSAPWRSSEVEAARQLRTAITDVVFAKTEQIRALNVQLVQRNRELQDFAYIASHDLQEPLRKIRAFSDLLKQEYGASLAEDARFYLGRVADAAARMSGLLNDLLIYSRVLTRGQDFRRIDLNVTLAELLDYLAPRLEETGAEIDVGPLPTLDADAGQLRRLLLNLLDNALKFRHPERPPRIRVRGAVQAPADPLASPGASMVELLVEDNGLGFDEKYRDRIFTPFQRLHGRGVYAGTGMGLATARRIAERHGGTVTANSEPGVGSRFVVTLRQHGTAPPPDAV